jgi:4-hydroxy-tetrahydrodipicolinate reductase
MLAAILNVELDRLDEFCERWYTPHAFQVPIGRIGKGSLAAVRFGVAGVVDGEARLFAEHVTRMRDDTAPEWPQPPTGSASVHRVEIEGSPSLTLDVCMRTDETGHTGAGLLATAMRLVNAIPAVVAAPPGIATALDLKLGLGRNLLSA